MPRIRRWFPVNHNINRDPEVWVMRQQIGEKALSIWLEFLSIADQHEGQIPGDYQPLIRSVSGTCQATVRTVSAVYQYAISKVWLKSEPTLHVVNYWNYHRHREPIKNFFGSLPSEPSEPKDTRKAAEAAPPKIKDIRPQTEYDELLRLAAEVGKLDKADSRGTTKQLCQWVIVMGRRMAKEPPERTKAVQRACLEIFRQKITGGYQVATLWGLLDTIYNKERTKHMQGPENESHKRGSLVAFGEVMDKIRAGEK